MRTLSSQELLELYETGERQHPSEKALTLLVAGCPERDKDELANLSIGQRDALLFTLRELTLGPDLDMYSECPVCHAQLEFSMDTADISADYKIMDNPAPQVEAEGYIVRFRLPTSIDLASVINLGMEDAYKTLLRRCVLQASHNNAEVLFEAIPETVTLTLISKMLEYDPLSEVILNLECAACSHRWPMILDIASFFWTELELQAERLFRQVHILAQAYGWQEKEILSMSAWRRQHYIDMVLS